MKKNVIQTCLFFLCVLSVCVAQQRTYEFEDLGKPIRSPLTIEFVTDDEVTGPIAWGALTDAEKNVLVGVHVDDGRLIEVDLSEYGKANALLLFKASERFIYMFTGKSGRFLKYDIRLNEIEPVGEKSKALYWMKKSFTEAPDGRIYVGTYPRAAVAVLNPKADEVEIIDRVSTNSGSEYVINPASDMNGIIYFPTGMKHGELWSYNPKTGKKKQILPKKMMTYGAAQIWRAADGQVYGRKGNVTFLCTENEIVEGKIQEAFIETRDNLYGNVRALSLNKEGNLVLEDQISKKSVIVESTFDPSAHEVFSVGDIYNGKLYGSGMKPGHVFTYDTNTGELDDLGRLTQGGIQVYDIMAYQNKLFMTSYTGGYIDVFNVQSNGLPIDRKPIAHLHRMAKQERLLQLTLGTDGNIYSPTMPIKGFLGGTLVRVNPKSLETKVFQNVVHNQSLMSVTAVRETGELFLTSSVQGGTSSKPTEKEAVVVVWDTEREQVTYTGKPVKGARSYGKAVQGNNGMLYGTALDTIFVFNPLQKKVIAKTSIERQFDNKPGLVLSETLGPDGFVYGIDNRNGQLFRVDTSTNKIEVLSEDKSLINARFAEVKLDGYLYYPNHARLMRVKVVR